MEQFHQQYPWGFAQGYYNIRSPKEYENGDLIIERIFYDYSIVIKDNYIKVYNEEEVPIIENKISRGLGFDLNRTLHYIYLRTVQDVDWINATIRKL